MGISALCPKLGFNTCMLHLVCGLGKKKDSRPPMFGYSCLKLS